MGTSTRHTTDAEPRFLAPRFLATRFLIPELLVLGLLVSTAGCRHTPVVAPPPPPRLAQEAPAPATTATDSGPDASFTPRAASTPRADAGDADTAETGDAAPTDATDKTEPADRSPFGPAPIRSQHPLVMTLLDFEMRDARTEPAGHVRLDSGVTYSSMFQVDGANGDRAAFDGEWAQLAFDLRVGITDRLEFFVGVPFLYTTSGFLDSFLIDYHDFWNLPQGGRDDAPNDQWDVTLAKKGREAWSLAEDTFGIQDIPFGLAFAVLREQADDATPGLLVRTAVEAPVGDDDDGFGNGKWDFGLGAVLEKSVWVLTFSGGVDYAWVGKADSFRGTDVDVDDLFGAFLNVEVRLTSWLAGQVGVDYLSQPVDGLDLKTVDDDQLMLVIGGTARLGRATHLRFDFVEDLIQDVSPDFSARLGLDIRF